MSSYIEKVRKIVYGIPAIKRKKSLLVA